MTARKPSEAKTAAPSSKRNRSKPDGLLLDPNRMAETDEISQARQSMLRLLIGGPEVDAELARLTREQEQFRELAAPWQEILERSSEAGKTVEEARRECEHNQQRLVEMLFALPAGRLVSLAWHALVEHRHAEWRKLELQRQLVMLTEQREGVRTMVRDRMGRASRSGKTAAEARHSKPGGSRDKARRIQAIWATGKYSNRDLCAEEECGALGMSFSAARKALRGTPNHD
ncbi:MAG: hypothetical protein Q8R01_13545 [Ramlibacter sp.]|nr:hypothetical protein [Ramlibacter sp.]